MPRSGFIGPDEGGLLRGVEWASQAQVRVCRVYLGGSKVVMVCCEGVNGAEEDTTRRNAGSGVVTHAAVSGG